MPSDKSDGAVVTGAASGIGRAIAAGLAADGFSVVIADLDEVNGRAAAEEIAASNQGRAIFQRVDVTDRTSVSAAIETCTRHFGSIKVMVNNAGFNKPEPLLEASEAIWHKIMDVNALGVMIGIQEAAKAMIAAGTKSKIINTASIAGRTGYPDFAPYCASKFAVVALTHAGARALAGKGITVNAFAPGVVATPLWQQLDKDLMAMGQFGARRGDGEFLQLDPAWSCRAARRRGRHGQVPGVAGIRLHDRSGPDDRRRNDSAMGRGLASEGMKRSSPASRHPSRLACARSSG
jgi:meso-butanediol dehydrogenase/(S,S)-butanediol dehydrogenase/diacetyl reductase